MHRHGRGWVFRELRLVHFKVGEQWFTFCETCVAGGAKQNVLAHQRNILWSKICLRILFGGDGCAPKALAQSRRTQRQLLAIIGFNGEWNLSSAEIPPVVENDFKIVIARGKVNLRLIASWEPERV